METRHLPALLVTFALAAGAARADGPVKAPPTRPVRIAFVDVDGLFRLYQRSVDLKKDLDAVRTDYRKKIDRVQREITYLRRGIEEYAIGTPQFEALKAKLKAKGQAGSILMRQAQQDTSRKNALMIRVIYADVSRAVEACAKARKIDFVIKQRRIPDYNEEQRAKDSPETAVMDISRRALVYANPEYDLTKAVADILNRDYARKKAAEAKGKPK